MSLAAFLGAVGSFARVQEFLISPERNDMRALPPSSSSSPSSSPSSAPSSHTSSDNISQPKVVDLSAEGKPAHAISVTSASFGWDTAKSPVLKDVSLHVPWGKLTMVVGPVGCGKSTLLHGLLGEIPILPGSGSSADDEKSSSSPSIGTVRLGSASVAYCPQNPWHMNGTVRDAIIGASSFDAQSPVVDEKWYSRVVTACALRPDFAQLPQGDASRIGSGGIALSGGQSQRIALARAVYARRKIVILDDVLSGLDLSTENHVFHALFGERGLCREVGSSVILVSSSGELTFFLSGS